MDETKSSAGRSLFSAIIAASPRVNNYLARLDETGALFCPVCRGETYLHLRGIEVSPGQDLGLYLRFECELHHPSTVWLQVRQHQGYTIFEWVER